LAGRSLTAETRTTASARPAPLRLKAAPSVAQNARRQTGNKPAAEKDGARRKEGKMRGFGWAITVIVGGYAALMLLKSIPDAVRYVKISTM
jgi:hypothetical protein